MSLCKIFGVTNLKWRRMKNVKEKANYIIVPDDMFNKIKWKKKIYGS